MSINTRVIKTDPGTLWEVLCDGWLYPLWVVGASRMREVDDTWPAVGAQLHHSAGSWPLLLNDETTVLEVRPIELLVLQAKGWPLGEATVRITIKAAGEHSEVTIQEDPTAGPGRFVPKVIRDVPLHARNTEALRRLAYVAERRGSSAPSA